MINHVAVLVGNEKVLSLAVACINEFIDPRKHGIDIDIKTYNAFPVVHVYIFGKCDDKVAARSIDIGLVEYDTALCFFCF